MKSILVPLSFLLSSLIFAQENILDPNSYGFEQNTNWTSNDSSTWEISSDKSLSGNSSLKFELADDAVVDISNGLYSIETGYTISLVRSGKNKSGKYILASTYEGYVMAVNFNGVIQWINELSGFMNHDLWADDMDGDGNDEIFAANADGNVYCLDHTGKIKWQFKKNDVPMHAVCVVSDGTTKYAVAGSYDRYIYYLNADGSLVKSIDNGSYSIDSPWGTGPQKENGKTHIANHLRPFKKSDGKEGLIMTSAIHTSSAPGHVYLFDVLSATPYKSIKHGSQGTLAHLTVVDTDGDGADEFLLGQNGFRSKAKLLHLEPDSETVSTFDFSGQTSISNFGYRYVMGGYIPNGTGYKLLGLYGADIAISGTNGASSETEVLHNRFSYNDLFQIDNKTLLIASAQSGGSCIHVVNLEEDKWKNDYEALLPPGKITKMLTEYDNLKAGTETFQKPSWERENRIVRMLTESRTGIESVIEDYKANYSNPVFYHGKSTPHAEVWDRSVLDNQKYEDMRDGRRTYDWTQQEVLDFYEPLYNNEYGMSFWGGHGTDPYIISQPTVRKIIDYGFGSGKHTNIVYPELEAHDAAAEKMLNDLIFPLAEYARDKNSTIYIRTKHTFWLSIIHKPLWSKLMSGEFADVLVPSMEETNSKLVDATIAARMGVWTSGAVDEWGSRFARDNTSYDRLRELSHQMLPNHFLRQTIYHLSCGATNQNNFAVDQPYFSIIYDLVRKGVIYVPNRDEIVSISPVHLSIIEPNEEWVEESNEVKWTVNFSEDRESNHPAIISRVGGEWSGAPLTEWDYSLWAAGSKERRLESLPTYKNGMVLFTPPQSGIHKDSDAPRGKLSDNLHPMYSSIMKEYFTDGVDYYNQNGLKIGGAKDYYTTIKNDLEENSELLPLTVNGRVAWIVAQTDDKHLRLTIVDGGYINPDNRVATVSFKVAIPVKMTDLLTDETFDLSNPDTVKIEIPCGGVRFIDIEISNNLN